MPVRPCLICGSLTTSSRCQAHRLRNGSTHQWRTTRTHILTRDHWTCRYCHAPATTVDHITPLAHGGTNHPTNLTAACTNCNARKGARTT